MKLVHLCWLFFLLCFPLFNAFASIDLKNIMQRYAQSSGVKMDFKKNTHLKLLKKTKMSKGQIFIKKGSLFLTVEDALHTKILFDGKDIWYITSSEGEQRQAVRIALTKASKNKMLLSFLFHPDWLFQKFRFVSSHFKGRAQVVVLEPINKNSDIHSFSVKVEKELILKAWLKRKNPEDEEEYTFSNIRFNQKISPQVFQIKNYQ